MAFLFGKSKKGTGAALPAATRDISSAHGPESRIPTATSLDGPRDGMQRRGTVGTQQTPPGSSINTSFTSAPSMKSPEPGSDVKMRTRADSDLNVSPYLDESHLLSILLESISLIDLELSLTLHRVEPVHFAVPPVDYQAANHSIHGLNDSYSFRLECPPSLDTAPPSIQLHLKKDGYT